MWHRVRSIRVILLLTIGALSLTIGLLLVRDIGVEWRKLKRVDSLRQASQLSDRLFDATEKLSVERDIAFSILHTSDAETIHNLVQRLQDTRREEVGIFAASMQDLTSYHYDDLAEDINKAEAQFAQLENMRRQIDTAIALPVEQRDRNLASRWFNDSTAMITQTQSVWMEFVKHYTDIDPYVTLQMRFKHILGIIMGYSGRQRALIGRFLAENVDPTPDEQADLLRWWGTVNVSWQISETLAGQGGLTPAITPYLDDARSHYFSVYDMMRDIFYVPGAHTRPYPISVEFWLDLATQANDSLYALKNAAFRQSRDYVEMLEAQAKRSIAYHVGILVFSVGLCLYTWWLVAYRVILPINTMADALICSTEGKEVDLKIAAESRRDEIGKLAQALRMSQQNADNIRRHAAEIAHYADALERSNHELDDFAYIASHDLKEPLRGLQNHARFLLEDNKERLDEDSVKRLDRMVYLGERMERLVSDLLYYSRIGRQEMAVQPADMNEVIVDIRNTLDVFLNERHAHIDIPKFLPTVTCDKTRVTEVFRNLITNAIKYNDASDKVVEIGYADKGETPDGVPCENIFSVRDNGRGIAPEFHKDIFRMFKRLQNEPEAKDQGTGVGLTFVKKIVERHGGTIWLDSAVGKGTTFYFTVKGNAA